MQFNERLAHGFTFNTQIIHRLTDGLTHADSLKLPPFKSNSINWVLGHIVISRRRAQRLLGVEPTWTDEQAARYQTGTETVSTGTASELSESGGGVIALADQLAALDATAESLAAALHALTDDDLAVVPEGHEQSLGESIHGLHWHETYHVGQLELLRVNAGKTEKLFG